MQNRIVGLTLIYGWMFSVYLWRRTKYSEFELLFSRLHRVYNEYVLHIKRAFSSVNLIHFGTFTRKHTLRPAEDRDLFVCIRMCRSFVGAEQCTNDDWLMRRHEYIVRQQSHIHATHICALKQRSLAHTAKTEREENSNNNISRRLEFVPSFTKKRYFLNTSSFVCVCVCVFFFISFFRLNGPVFCSKSCKMHTFAWTKQGRQARVKRCPTRTKYNRK